MILVGLSGGLGNQMFQYAAGFALSRRLNTGMVLETSWYQHDFAATDSTPRQTELDQLKVDECDYTHSPPPQGRLRAGIALLGGRRIVAESDYPPERFAQLRHRLIGRAPCYHLLGYWQNPAYFSQVSDTIRRQFRIRSGLNPSEALVSNRIREEACIGVHVRRGDYVHHARTAAHHGVPRVKYYEDATSVLSKDLGIGRVFVFSDDPGWCRSNLDFGALEVQVVDQGSTGAVEMALLSECAHHVLSNSSFSFWGAWLADGRTQRVIAPRSWLADGRPLAGAPDHWELW